MPNNIAGSNPGADENPGNRSSGAARAVLAARLADAARAFSRPEERLRAEEEELFRCLDQGLLNIALPASLPDFVGSEHEVWSDGARVIKATIPGSFGRLWGSRRFALPSEYLHRMALIQENFGLPWNVVGLVREIGRIRIVSEQPFIQGTSPSQKEIAEAFGAMGFNMKRHRFGDYWFREDDKLIAFDVEPGNLVLTQNGIVPIDVILQTQD